MSPAHDLDTRVAPAQQGRRSWISLTAADLTGRIGWMARSGSGPADAGGFLPLHWGPDRTTPNWWIALVIVGAVLIALDLTVLGLALVMA